jgi:hypothetical protein
MKKSMKVMTALAGAAVVVAGGTAFTAGNDMIATRTFGYGETSVTGVTVTKETVNPNADNALNIDSIVFETSTPVVDMGTGYTATLQVNGGATDYNYSCSFGGWATPKNVITCPTIVGSDTHQLTATELSKIGLTVKTNAED